MTEARSHAPMLFLIAAALLVLGMLIERDIENRRWALSARLNEWSY